MSSDNKKKGPVPSITSDKSLFNRTFTVPQEKLPPALRGKPVFITNEFVLFPEDVATVSLRSMYDETVFSTGANEMFECVIVYRTQEPDKNVMDLVHAPDHLPIATLARIIKVDRGPERELRYTLRGLKRIYVDALSWDNECNVWRAALSECQEIELPEIGEELFEMQSKMRALRQVGRQIFEHQTSQPARDLLRILDKDNSEAGMICDKIARTLDIPTRDRANVLNLLSIASRIEYTLNLLTQQLQMARIMSEITANVRSDLDKQQRDYFLRQQIKVIREQLGDATDQNTDLDDLKKRIDELDASDEVKEFCLKSWKRMQQMQPTGSEYGVALAHLETLLDIPWNKTTIDNNDIIEARRILDEDHYGLKDVKQRLIEFLAVRALNPELKAPIICLYGPPGVGKTSLGKSVAQALGRKFHRISLGGVHDESEIRGHRRTYVASMPGRIVQALRRVQTMNPVIMLDEIDKVTSDQRGDPSSALLEVLDPEQNNAFSDNYVETPVDLSQVLFLTTANNIETIAPALRDRMEIIEIPGYTSIEKRHIATDHLVPKLLKDHGLLKTQLDFKPEALDLIIAHYTREAGVRQLEQRLSAIMRKVATAVAEARSSKQRFRKITLAPKMIESYLGKQRYDHEIAQRHPVSGVATGLAWTPVGGEILFIESTIVPGKGDIVMTGKLGDVMQESVRTALTLIRARAEKLGLPEGLLDKKDVHLHFPAAATPKDGPSAGSAIFCALLSLFTDKLVPASLAMTGEISLRGLVLPIGGLREKALGAYRAGIRTILFPKQNLRDLDDIPEEVRRELDMYAVETIDQVIDIVFADGEKSGKLLVPKPSLSEAPDELKAEVKKVKKPRTPKKDDKSEAQL